MKFNRPLTIGIWLALSLRPLSAAEEWSGIYPSLAMFNQEGECGTGALVPWAGKLWALTYAPHKPTGSSDKLYEIDEALNQVIRPESIGGTPANRMIHSESNQLFIGPYAIDGQRNVRAIPYSSMFGRPTGNARHLSDPANKIYYGTMEEGVYEVDVHTLEVKELWADEQRKEGRHSDLPGYHGKGLYSGQGRLIYAQDGEHGKAAEENPNVPSGVLAEWDGKAEKWTIVRRGQFADVTGPGGILGNPKPASDPIWSIGWDPRSLILMVLDQGAWHSYRLPKASRSYDGAHGWNIEWPRIREIGEKDFLMTMHGMFWRFPKDFRPGHSAGIAARSSYLKIVGDFCHWNNHVVLGCDDAAKSEFLNSSVVKGKVAPPGQSQSNLVFLDPAQLDHFGPALGRGAVWVRENVKAGKPSDAYLFDGFAQRGLHLSHGADAEAVFTLETDSGDGNWKTLREVKVPARQDVWVAFAAEEKAAWIRVRSGADVPLVTAAFYYSAKDDRAAKPAPIFSGIAPAEAVDYLAGVLWDRGGNLRTLAVGATEVAGGKILSKGFYELDANMILKKAADNALLPALEKSLEADTTKAVQRDAASVVIIDDEGRRWRLPMDAAYATEGAVPLRVAREVVTERNLFSMDGLFYELPARNAGGLAGVRPISTHHSRVADFASYRGLMVMTGIDPASGKDNRHLIRSADGKAAVWVGSIDDLWAFGKPSGKGGPWMKTPVKKDAPSDPYLMTGFDHKTLALSHDASSPVRIRVEVDPTGNGTWAAYETFAVAPGATLNHVFPEGYGACWVRVVAESDCVATAQLAYN